MMKLHDLHFSFDFQHPTYGTTCSVYESKEGFFYTGEPDKEFDFHFICLPDEDPKLSLSELFF